MTRYRVTGGTKGLLEAYGATEDQEIHMAHLGIALDDEVTTTSGLMTRAIGTIGGIAAGQPGHRERLDHLLTAGLRDRSQPRTVATGLHLFRHGPKKGAGCLATCFDEVGLALLEHMGLSPSWILLMAAVVGDVEIHDDVSARGGFPMLRINHISIDDDEPIMLLSIRIGDGVEWTGEGVILKNELPETILGQAVGRPLRTIVSHPVVDRHDLSIRSRRGRLLDIGYVRYHQIDWSGRGFKPRMAA